MPFITPPQFEPPGRPSGPAGVIWDLVWGSKRPEIFNWEDPNPDLSQEELEARLRLAKTWWSKAGSVSARRTIVRIAENKKVDAFLLFATTLAWYGPENAGEVDLGRVARFGNALNKKGPRETLNEWYARSFKGAERGLRQPGEYLEIAGYTEPVSAAKPTLFEKISPRWEPVMRVIKEAAARARRTHADVIDDIGFNELFAAIWAAGYTPNELRKNPSIADRVADNFASARDFATLNDWFLSVYEKPAKGRVLPDRFLRGVSEGRGFPGSVVAGEGEKKTREDFLDPVQFEGPGGIPVRQSDMVRFHQQYQPIFHFYANRNPTEKELRNIVRNGTSTYQLALKLTREPGFFRSQAWKENRLTYVGVWNDMHGATGRKPPRQLIRKAIVNKWGPGEFAEALRGREDYLESNEFRGRFSALQNVYATVFGGPITASVRNTLNEAALARWSEDQFATWLRSQPEYGSSVEFAGKVRNLNTALSNAFGAPERRVKIPTPQPPSAFDLPDSERIEGAPGLAPVSAVPAGSEFE